MILSIQIGDKLYSLSIHARVSEMKTSVRGLEVVVGPDHRNMRSIDPGLFRGIGGVYVIQAANGLVKIGQSANVGTRYMEISTMAAEPCRLIGVIPCVDHLQVERELHEHFAAYRKHGEWFHLGANILVWLKGNFSDGIYAWDAFEAPRDIHQEADEMIMQNVMASRYAVTARNDEGFCPVCGEEVKPGATYCSKACKQAAYRFRKEQT